MGVHGSFDYEQAFSRNLGWVTVEEQARLRASRVAIAGLGGVGGIHLLTLTRLGIGKFHLADFDTFDLPNFNRQAGASVSTLGLPKIDVMAAQARDINPQLNLTLFEQGITPDNIDAFLENVDVYVDGLDFFVFDVRARVFSACAARGIPAITCAPLGMGVACLNFLPGGMSFEDYFGLMHATNDTERALRFMLGLAPAGLQMGYLADPTRIDLGARRGPSTAMACQLCAGVAATQALKVLLRRGPLLAAPYGMHFDAYRNRYRQTWRPGGWRNPLQQLLWQGARRRFRDRVFPSAPLHDPGGFSSMTPIEQILDLARWAPSGDNAQPWRFEILATDRLRVHVQDEAHCNVYDFDARPTLLTAGFLLESIRLAATRHGWTTQWSYQPDTAHKHLFEVQFNTPPSAVPQDGLADMLVQRSVDRRRYRDEPLSITLKATLQEALQGLQIRWFESLEERKAVAQVNAMATHIRLSIPEAWEVHRRILDWEHVQSPQGVPIQAVGVDTLTARLMHFLMQKWSRAAFMNRYLAGTLMPQWQLDHIPGRHCAAHFMITASISPTLGDLPDIGQKLQRFWLTATQHRLVLQPSLAPLCFAYYARRQRAFTQHLAMCATATTLATQLAALHGGDPDCLVFMGRIGYPLQPTPARSVRRPLKDLMYTGKNEPGL